MQEVRQIAEALLGIPLPDMLWNVTAEQAKCKLERIIDREGDADGERKKPYYLAQLVVEAIRQEMFTAMCIADYEEKRNARAKAQGISEKQPHYSITSA